MADSKQEVAEAVEFVKTISIEPAQEGEKKGAEVRKTQWLFYPPQNFIFKLLTHSHRKPPLYKKRRKKPQLYRVASKKENQSVARDLLQPSNSRRISSFASKCSDEF